jgi:hypothetical protein
MKVELLDIRLYCDCSHCGLKFTHSAPWSALKRESIYTCDGTESWLYLIIACPRCRESEEVTIIDD